MRQRLPPALQERDFRFLWSAIFSMRFAENMIAVAVGWQVFSIRKDPLDLGLIGLMQFLPSAAFMLVAGQIADRYHRRRLLHRRCLRSRHRRSVHPRRSCLRTVLPRFVPCRRFRRERNLTCTDVPAKMRPEENQ